MKVMFCGLLYLEQNENNAVNLPVGKDIDINKIYLRNALLLAESLHYQSQEFFLFTNDRTAILEKLGEFDSSVTINIIEIHFSIAVPENTRFHAAHMRIDLLKYLGFTHYDYIICLDLDIVALNPLPVTASYLIQKGIPGCFDLTDQLIFEHGRERILQDLSLLLGHESEGRWYGGEFIGGPPVYFSDLYDAIKQPFQYYIQNINKVCHLGFELFYSAAVEELRSRYQILDVGKAAIIGRYWSVANPYHLPPLDYYRQHFLLHLPADKRFLAEWHHNHQWQSDMFWKKYTYYAEKRLFLSTIKKLILR